MNGNTTLNPEITNNIIDQFRILYDSIPASENSNKSLRDEALESFSKLGIPGKHDEEWRYTNMLPVFKRPLTQSINDNSTGLTRDQINKFLIAGFDANILVFYNGRAVKEFTHLNFLPEETVIGTLGDNRHHPAFLKNFAKLADHRKETFTALNTAFSLEGAFIYIPVNAIIEQAIHIIHISDNCHGETFSNMRNLLVMGEGSSVQLVESFQSIGSGAGFNNTVTEIFAGEDSLTDLYILENENNDSFQVNNTYIHQEKKSTMSWIVNSSLSLS